LEDQDVKGDTIKMDFKETDYEAADYIHMAQDREQCQLTLIFLQKPEEILFQSQNVQDRCTKMEKETSLSIYLNLDS
jgi:hypothetical protein